METQIDNSICKYYVKLYNLSIRHFSVCNYGISFFAIYKINNTFFPFSNKLTINETFTLFIMGHITYYIDFNFSFLIVFYTCIFILGTACMTCIYFVLFPHVFFC